jgi:hypothetical protein
MTRKRGRGRNRQRQFIDEHREPWYKKLWFGVSVLSVVLFTLIINATSLLSNLENFPKDASRTTSKFLSWYFDDEQWTGLWSSFPEGYVDLVEMELSDVDLRLDITSENGQIEGMIVSQKMCEAVPFSPFLLVDGEVDGSTALIRVYDFVGGRRQDFAAATLKREGVIMTIVPTDGLVDWLPNGARIGLHPEAKDDEKNSFFFNFCKEERAAAMKSLRKNHPTNDNKQRRPMSDFLPE